MEARDAEALAPPVKLVLGAGAVHAGAHRILVVLGHEDDRQLPQLGHVEGLVDLALIGCAVAEISDADPAVPGVFVLERQPRAARHQIGKASGWAGVWRYG